MSEINEVQFTANVKSWIDAICREMAAADPNFPFIGAEIEDRKGVGAKRRDLILRPRNNPQGVALTGEVKLPDRPEGRTPYNETVVLDAHQKANAIGVPYFFTWNVNRFVLWETFKKNTRIIDRAVAFWDWSDIADSDDLSRPDNQELLKRRWEEFLLEYAEIYRGAKPFPRRPLDQWFIHLLECALDRPTICALSEIAIRYRKDGIFRGQLDPWIVKNLGATIAEGETEDNLKRAAKYSCYIAVNRIVFYDALRRKYSSRLKPLSISRFIKTGGQLLQCLKTAFKEAQKVTDDYETVFQGDSFGDQLPFLNDLGVESWRGLVEQVDAYDFTALDYGIIGQIFDGLISPRERHRFGQHYTKSEIVDLINAFCIRSPRAKVMDPACGGGTFLIRAYARKKWLAQRERKAVSHESLLSDIYGTDNSAYAVHLSTISLATRDLVRASNYPRVACTDFFEVKKGSSVIPAGISEGKDSFSLVPVPELDAIVGNPPYIRQERLSLEQKASYPQLCARAWPGIILSGRSDIHVYFWPYASSFLKGDGYFGFLTSSSWLDVEYGFKLQRWILENFAIVAVMESSVEPWFTDARVATTVTILKCESEPQKRLENPVRFVQIRRPLVDILLDYERAGDPLEATERIRDFIESQTQNSENQNWRIRVVRQRDLISGLDLAGDEDEEESEEGQAVKELNHTDDPAVHHSGGKWGVYLRAPDIFFELMDRCGDRFVPLGEIADIRRGVTTGCDAFFFPRDITDERLKELGEKAFKETYGLTAKQAEKIRVCLAGDGSPHLIEAEYLEPEVHSLMEIDSIEILEDNLKRNILLVNKLRSQLRGTHVLKYIKWGESGESKDIHLGTTCQSRGQSRNWYDLNPNKRSDMFWPMIQKYRHIIAMNSKGYVCNHNLFDIYTKQGIDKNLLCAVLNSSIVLFIKNFYGRWAGTEGTLKTEVVDVVSIPIPDVRKFKPQARKMILKYFSKLKSRKIGYIRDEIKMEDRAGLDKTILLALGFSNDDSRNLLAHLYSMIDQMYASYRQIELKANANRARAARRGKSTPQSIAAEIWEAYEKDSAIEFRRFPADFLPRVGEPRCEVIEVPEGAAKIQEMFGSFSVVIDNKILSVGKEARAQLLFAAAREGYAGPLALPESAASCRRILADWEAYRSTLTQQFQSLAAQRSADPQLIERIVTDLWRRYRRWSEVS